MVGFGTGFWWLAEGLDVLLESIDVFRHFIFVL